MSRRKGIWAIARRLTRYGHAGSTRAIAPL
jgi:hypothetical protein